MKMFIPLLKVAFSLFAFPPSFAPPPPKAATSLLSVTTD